MFGFQSAPPAPPTTCDSDESCSLKRVFSDLYPVGLAFSAYVTCNRSNLPKPKKQYSTGKSNIGDRFRVHFFTSPQVSKQFLFLSSKSFKNNRYMGLVEIKGASRKPGAFSVLKPHQSPPDRAL